jgi:hypothetical protein
MIKTESPNYRRLIRAAFAAFCLSLVLVGAAHATPITYTFTGIGSGTANGNAFTGNFSFVFTGDTVNIDPTAAPFYYLHNLGGTFTEGSYSATLSPTVTLVASADPTLDLINFFNATFDGGLVWRTTRLPGMTFRLRSVRWPLTF